MHTKISNSILLIILLFNILYNFIITIKNTESATIDKYIAPSDEYIVNEEENEDEDAVVYEEEEEEMNENEYNGEENTNSEETDEQ